MAFRGVAVSLLAAAVAAPSAANAAPVAKNFVGIISDDVLGGDPGYRTAQLQAHAAAGVGLERAPFAWNTIETAPGQYDFSLHDAYVGELARRGMDLLPVLIWTPAFRSSAPPGDTNPTSWPPSRYADLGDFAKVLIGRYGPQGTFWTAHPDIPKRPVRAWEIWNEPNLPSYWPGGSDPAEYTRLLKATSPAIKAADPGALVVAAGLPDSSSGTPLLSFFNGMEDAGAASAYDVAAVHAYASDDEGTVQKVRDVRNAMSAHGDIKPIWVTELGWGTAGAPSPFGTDEPGQAMRLGCAVARLTEARTTLGIRGLIDWEWRDQLPAAPTGHWGNYAGLLRSDGSSKPGLAAFTQSALKVEAPGGANRPPVACFSISEPAPVTGETVRFTSTSTDAPDGSVASQAWDLDNDGSFDDGAATTAARSFAGPGTYTVRMRATDNGGLSQVTSRTVTVSAEARVSGSTLYYTAGGAETNNVTVSGGSGSYSIRDTGATMTAGPGCAQVAAGDVTCSGTISSIRLDLRDGNDSATNGSSTGMTAAGGPGNDTLRGGPGSDTFEQGTAADGADTLVGNGGADTVSYAGRITPVSVSVDGQAGDGASGEGDNVAADVENITGGWADDVLVGNAADNTLDGGLGKDSFDGGAGNDTLVQSSIKDGADVLAGGTGTDTVTYKSRKLPVRVSLDDQPNDGADTNADGVVEEGDNVKADVENVTSGIAADRLEGNAAANTLVGYKGDDVIVGGGGDDSLDGQSGADSLSGGAGRDRALYASRTLPATVDIDGAWDDGTTEDVSGSRRDNVMTDVESIVGGSGDDTLSGSAADNTLDGGKGADAFAGLDGADTILAWDGLTDRNVLCGAGVDTVSADASDPVAASGSEACELVTRH